MRSAASEMCRSVSHLGAGLVAARERLDQRDVGEGVLAQVGGWKRARGRDQEARHAPAHHRRQLVQQLVLGELPEPLVEALVELDDPQRVATVGGGHHLARHRPQLPLDRRRPHLLHAAGHELLEHDAQRRDLVQLPRRQGRDPRAAARLALDQPLLRQPGERLAHRDVRHAELRRQRPLGQARPGRVDAGLDRHAQPLGDRLGQPGGGDGVERAHRAGGSNSSRT